MLFILITVKTYLREIRLNVIKQFFLFKSTEYEIHPDKCKIATKSCHFNININEQEKQMALMTMI